MTKVNFNPNFFDQIGRSARVTNLTVDAAERVAAIARSDAPVDSGDYRNGIHVVMKKSRRAVALVVGSDWKTLILEAKNGYLARALQKAARGG